ncbi:AzlC family ABC transporter permease [Marinobacterium rhizophilum]|uniref:AzlC family ABC transporter permease n=1 Tax=Marinobacterium rhizophilum TaxID=420402 RepID=A0ABY5HI37_9GAMM|nr:AzlC family ABC transporter permease [Marinobacterium rhizophilum]UTW11903.1 AzlC family ABC transporter permease [Marinobacterium rhizophilum]
MQYTTGKEAFYAGIRALLPAAPGVIPFGLVTGVTAIEQGLSPLTTIGMTVLFFAGAAQMAALQLLRNDAFPLVIIVTALVINLRFLMYSASMAPHFAGLPKRWTWPMSYVLSDQAYVLSILKFSSGKAPLYGHYFFAGAAFSMWLTWQLAVMAGVFLGAEIPASWSLDFAIPLVFLALLVPSVRNRACLVAACVGGAVAVLATGMAYNLGLLVASFCGIGAGLLVEHYQCRRPRRVADAGLEKTDSRVSEDSAP